MKFGKRFADWLETHWSTPAYAGWLLGGMALFLLLAAANTLAGWLYVISGVSLALLTVAAVLPGRSLQGMQIRRHPPYPVSVGDILTLELAIVNPSNQPKSLLQIADLIPVELGQLQEILINDARPRVNESWLEQIKTGRQMLPVEAIAMQGECRITQRLETRRRGVFHWQTVQLRTGAPLGLFWARRSYAVPGTAMVYPTVLSLSRCPLIDQIGREQSLLPQSQSARSESATEGTTRSLRPYRWGDPLRLVHWRTSARYGELRVRELEVFRGGQQVLICLDSGFSWHADDFEQAVIAAASLYFYAQKLQFQVQLWTPSTGPLQGNQRVLEALARVQPGEASPQPLPKLPLLWLCQNPESLLSLPPGSRWLLWTADRLAQAPQTPRAAMIGTTGLLIDPAQPLQVQLQALPT